MGKSSWRTNRKMMVIDIPIPEKLDEILEMFEMTPDRSERSEMLIYWAEKFKDVPERVASRPFDESHRVPSCESQAFVFYEKNSSGNLDFYFAVENPQGISAKAICALMQETVSGASRDQIASLDPDLVFILFDKAHLGIARSTGLRAIIKMIKVYSEKFYSGN